MIERVVGPRFLAGMVLPVALLAAGAQASAQSKGDAAKGKAVFARCSICHSLEPGKKMLGPSLSGFVGRKAGAVPGFAYSPAMAKSGIVWDRASFDAFIANPRAKLPGNKMIFAGLPKPEDRANLFAYLQTAAKK